MKFTLIVIAIYSVYYGLNIIFDLLKSNGGATSSTSKNTIQIIQEDKILTETSGESDDNVEQVRNNIPTVNISFEDIEKEYKEKFSVKETLEKTSVSADLGIEVLEQSAGVSVYQLDNQNFDTYAIA